MKFIKWSLIVVVSLFILLFAYLTLIFEPNDFKPQIVDAVKKQTGRELQINQDLSWTFFPSIGISLGDITLSNPNGFKNPTMVSVKGIVAEVALLPLFSKEVEISQLNLDGLTVNLDTYKNGRSSFDGLDASQAAKPNTETKTTQKPSSIQLSSLNIGGVAITNTQINMFDELTGKSQSFTLDEFRLGEFSLGQLAEFSYKFSAILPEMQLTSEGKGQLKVSTELDQIAINNFVITNNIEGEAIPNKKMAVSLTTQVQIDNKIKQLGAQLDSLSVDDIKATGNIDVNYASQVPNVMASLNFSDINLDKFLPKSEESKGKSVEVPSKEQPQEPDLSGLNAVNLKLDLTAKSIAANNIKTSNWVMNLALKDGVLDLSKLSTELYQGKLLTSARLDGRKKVASYQFDTSINGVQIRPLLTDAAEVDLLAGSTQFSITGSGKSLIPDNIKKNLLAKGQFEVADGALYGVNIPQMIRDAKAKLAGDLNATSTGEKKTDFTSLTGSFSMSKGIVTNPDLAMASPLIRLGGKGNVNLLSEVLDYALTTSVVGSLEGQGGGERDALYGIEIPFAISGTMSEPKFALDTAALFDAKLKQETDKAKDKLKDQLLKKLGGF
ncbi:AsmA family protein [Shewanella psychrotolerans]|uniref:AsmA family protein n=1 Tax=Shewanella psychrotolerans TaxID=2864206 RepID=UPI001C661567|nr:AsmA family protein [Shewanella psychrotolerans]QYJ99981.1 AsmA family protein [Shewanella psychrotolerans]